MGTGPTHFRGAKGDTVSTHRSNDMDTKIWGFMIGLSLMVSSTASGQVVSGVMTVTGAEMH